MNNHNQWRPTGPTGEGDNPHPKQLCTIIVEQLKKSGEFDKYRREIVEKLMQSEDVQILIEQCKEIVENTVGPSATAQLRNLGIAQQREFVKNEIKRRRLIDNALNTQLPKRLDEVKWKTSDRIADLCRAEFGMPKQEIKEEQEVEGANLEPVDMEVSSGTGGEGSSSSSSSASVASSEPAGPAPGRSTKSSSASGSSQKRTEIDKAEKSDEKKNSQQGDGDGDDVDKSADSSRSTGTSSLSCNASEENSQTPSPDGMEIDTNNDNDGNSANSSENLAKSSAPSKQKTKNVRVTR